MFMPAFIPENAVIWAEIPVSDMARAKAFYAAVVGNPLTDQDGGPNPISVFASKSTVAGHIYPGKPAAPGTGPTIHLGVDKVEDAMERVSANGGQIVSPIIEIPSGRFTYCLDPDGNSFGVFSG
jgi:uncharacterized protein